VNSKIGLPIVKPHMNAMMASPMIACGLLSLRKYEIARDAIVVSSILQTAQTNRADIEESSGADIFFICIVPLNSHNDKFSRSALGLVGESPGVMVFCFIMRR